MSPVDVLAFAMWPLAAIGIWLSRSAFAFGAKDVRRPLIAAAALALILGPFLILEIFFPHHSATVVALQYGILAAAGAGLLVMGWRVTMSRFRSMAVVVTGFLLLGGGLWFLVADFLVRRARVEGVVTDMRFGPRSPTCRFCRSDYFVYVGGRRYRATAAIFQAIETGQRIRARAGRASRRIMTVTTGRNAASGQ
jgi:membrane-bound ClpP family serine protease